MTRMCGLTVTVAASMPTEYSRVAGFGKAVKPSVALCNVIYSISGQGPTVARGDVNFPHPPPAARHALDQLAGCDPDLARIEAAAGPLPWRRRPPGFEGLLQAIVGQQISNQAAAAIWGRLRVVPGALAPAGLLALGEEALRGA